MGPSTRQVVASVVGMTAGLGLESAEKLVAEEPDVGKLAAGNSAADDRNLAEIECSVLVADIYLDWESADTAVEVHEQHCSDERDSGFGQPDNCLQAG